MDLSDKGVVITGAAGGVGSALAREFAAAGANLALLDADEARLGELEQELRAKHPNATLVPVVVDLTDEDAIIAASKRVMGELGQLSVLVNNAGIVLRGIPVQQISSSLWQRVMGINFMATVLCVQNFLPYMQADAGPGHIINIASISGLIMAGDRKTAAYSTSKYAVVAYSEALAAELAGSSIKVSIVAPAGVATTLYENSALQLDAIPKGETIVKTPDDIANGMPPAELAKRTFDLVGSDRLYLVTHEYTRPMIQSRFEKILAGFDD